MGGSTSEYVGNILPEIYFKYLTSKTIHTQLHGIW